MSTLKERMEMVRSEGRVESYRSWAEAAGLNESHIATIRSRNQDAEDVELRTLVALAHAAKISPVWLTFGLPDPSRVPKTATPDPAFGSVLLQLRARPLLESLIAAEPTRWRVSTILRALDFDGQASPPMERDRTWWTTILDSIETGKYDGTGL